MTTSKEVLNSILSINNDPYPALTDLQFESIDRKSPGWFLDHVGKDIFVACENGDYGLLKIINQKQAKELYRLQDSNIKAKFLNYHDRLENLLNPSMTIIETCDDEEWVESFLRMINKKSKTY